jgi:hypothetical protein
MVHDRRIDGEAHTFGNAGGLMMNAMTWWDHETESIWSQPWGRSIDGQYKGVELFLLPSQLTTWGAWKAEHPETLAMINGFGGTFAPFLKRFDPDFVIGLVLAEQANAFYFRDVLAAGIVNDYVGQIPVMVWAGDENFHAYIRQVDDQILTFRLEDDRLIDEETGSTWNITRGLATDGPLKGQGLQGVPSSSSFDWAWLDFYPESDVFQAAG